MSTCPQLRLSGTPAHDVVQRGWPFGLANVNILFVYALQAKLVLTKVHHVTVLQFTLLVNAFAVDHNTVGAAAVGNQNLIIVKFYYGVKTTDAGVIEHQVIGVAAAQSGDRLGKFQNAFFSVG